MTICFDLDGTLCLTHGMDYTGARPLPERIDTVNALKREGHTIIIDTARGSGTGEDWHERTVAQLASWGLEYDVLSCGQKPVADKYIDDRGMNADNFFGVETGET